MLKKCYSIVQKSLELMYIGTKSIGDVYLFHQVNNNRKTWNDNSCSITLEGFNNFIEALIAMDVNFLPINEVLANTNNINSKKRVFITFDDAYDDVYFHCFPILLKYQIPFMVFITYDFLDKKGYLTTEMVKEMMHSGLCSIGAHSMEHGMFRFMDKEDVVKEMLWSKRRLFDIFGINVSYMAYPFGSVYTCSKDNMKSAEYAGYIAGFSTLNAHLSKKSIVNRFFIPRENVNEENYLRVLRRKNAII